MRRRLAVLAVLSLGCTDAATRVAFDLEAGAKRLGRSGAASATVDHTPVPEPDGCPGGYTLQLSQESALLVWCQDSIGGPSVSSHTTTYHLNSVAVPRTMKIHKEAGQHVMVELAREGDHVVVTGLR